MTKLQKELFAHQDLGYKEFHCKLIPEVDPVRVIGVRMPALRKIVKKFAKTAEAEKFLTVLPHKYFEELNVHGLLINNCQGFEHCVVLLDAHLPYVDNWASCDLLKPQAFTNEPDKTFAQAQRWIGDPHPYAKRFAVLTLMNFYLDKNFAEEHLTLVGGIESDEYYVNMMLAWYFATALAKQWDPTIEYLKARCLPKWVQNKTIQKARESFRITPEQKEYLGTLKK
ncbi:MAG: DNA alkylation repair protein [Eggerthellaceae bacterium]|nr:DNA alkylation repair protein [Eggerthellaceae bacterium]